MGSSSLSVKEERIESIFESVDKEINQESNNNNNNNVSITEGDPAFNNDPQDEEKEVEVEGEERRNPIRRTQRH